MRNWYVVIGMLILLIPAAVSISQQSPTLEITGANASDLPTITITTNVLTRTNRPADNLTVDSFTLTGELAEVATIERVESIRDDNLSFATVLTIDVSSSMAGKPLDDAKAAASLFVESVGENDPIAIVTFSDRARLVQDYTTDKDQLLQVIDNLGFGGQTALYDAANLSIDVAADAPVPRRAVVMLSDGNEFGGLSASTRNSAFNEAIENGVTVYTIGLGYSIDQPYLETLSTQSNGRFYESPDSNELSTIYSDLAALFRSQYVLTLRGDDIPLDGTEYDFALQATTGDGETNIAEGVIRAPIPVPLVSLTAPDVALVSETTITPDIRADDEIAAVEYRFDGETLPTNDDNSVTIDPANDVPGDYTLSVRVTDVDGDSGTADAAVTIGAIATNASFSTPFTEPITEPTTVTLSVDQSQTPVTEVTYTILDADGATVAEATSSDAANDFPFTIEPITLAEGEYSLQADITNEGGATSSVATPFTVGEVPPRILDDIGLESGETLSEPRTLSIGTESQIGTEIGAPELSFDDADITPPDDLTLRPQKLPPGDRTLTVTVTDSRGNSDSLSVDFVVAALPAEVQFGELPETITGTTTLPLVIDSQTPVEAIRYAFDDGDAQILPLPDDDTAPAIPVEAAALGDGDHTLTVTVVNAGGETTASTPFNVQLPTATPTATPTVNQTGTAIALQATRNVQSTQAAIAEATQEAQASQTAIAEATQDAQASQTAIAEATQDAQASQTAVAEATQDAQASQTAIAEATQDAQASQTAIAEATQDAQASQTAIAEATQDAQASQTAIAEATQEAQASQTAESATTATEAAALSLASTQTADAPTATNTSEPTETDTAAPTATNTPEPTVTDTPAPTEALPTVTPSDIEFDAQDADAPPVDSFLVGAVILLGGLALLLIFFWLLLRNRGDE